MKGGVLMILVKRYFSEGSKLIMELEPATRNMSDVFKSIIENIEKYQCDEFRLAIHGVELIFQKSVTIEELHILYAQLTDSNRKLHITKEKYHQMEYKIQEFDDNHWKENEQYALLEIKLDQALLTKDIEWAKQIYEKMKNHPNFRKR